MPGTRQSTTGLPRKSSVQALKLRVSTRPSSISADVPDEGPHTQLRSEICNIFANAQRDTTTQRKLVVSLRKVQEACCYEPVKQQNHKKSKAERGGNGAGAGEGGGKDAFGEEDFNEEVGRCTLRVLTVRKSEPVGDRTVKFLGIFLNYASEKDNALSKEMDGDNTDIYAETPSSRLTSHILLLLLPLLSAKDKTVRFRATQITAHIINTLESIDDDLFQKMRVGLLRRIHDKETAVRVQAVLGLGRLAGEGDEDDDEEVNNGNRDIDDSNIDDSSINATSGRGGSSGGVLEKLIEALQHDPAAEVRRSLLLNLPLVPATLPLLLERARDVDPGARRGLYAKLLPSLGDFRHLSLTHREKLLRWGLRDRDESVRKATARLFRERWVEDCAGTNAAAAAAAAAEGQEEEANGQGNGGAVQQPAITKPDYDALLELLERIDIVNSGIEGGVAIEAMQHFWEGRPDYCDFITFEGAFWDVLTPESAFVARTFNTFCRNSDSAKYQAMVDDKMPEVTRFAFILQKQIGTLIELVRKCAATAADEEGENNNMEMEEDMVQHEFAVEQLLHIALRLDFTDEIGRRKMFSVMRESLALAELPEECTKLVVEILRIVCGNAGPGEREFCSIVLEAIAEVHDTIMGEDEDEQQQQEGAETASTQEGDESFHSARSEVSDGDGTPTTKTNRSATISRLGAGDDTDATSPEDEERAIKEIMVNMKCLHIAQCMLQNVQCVLEQNSHLAIMVDNLVIPAVRSQEAPIRERGLVCLGLCCLLSKTLANENLNLFIHCFSKGHEALQVIALEIISDILLTHPSLLAPLPAAPSVSASQVEGADASTATAATTKSQQPSQSQPQPSPYERPVLKMYSRALKSADSGVQSTGATALCKLMLAQVIREPELLRQLVLGYFDPDTSANATLRQALAYFLPVYCHSRASNTARMLSIVVPALHVLAGAAEEADGQDEDMVGLTVVAGHFAEWMDARRVVVGGQNSNEEEEEKKKNVEIAEAAAAVAGEALEKFCSSGSSKQERKALTAFLSKLYFPPPPTLAPENLAPLLDLLAETTDSRFVPDTTTRNALVKLHQSLSKYLPSIPSAEDGDGGVDGDETIRNVSVTSASASAAGRERDGNGNGDGNSNSNSNSNDNSRRESLAIRSAGESRRPSGGSEAGVGDDAGGNDENAAAAAAAAAATVEGANTNTPESEADTTTTMTMMATMTTTSIADPDAEGTVIGDETMAAGTSTSTRMSVGTDTSISTRR